MTKNNFKAILFASLIVALILPFSAMSLADAAPNENANDKAKEKTNGKLLIKDKNDMKNISKEKFVEMKKNHSEKSDSEKAKYEQNIQKVKAELRDWDKTKGIWITSIGIDHETGNINVSIERSVASEKNIKSVEKRLRSILGTDADITISLSDPLYLAGCSQTGDCNPIQGGTRISVEDNSICSMGYRAVYNDKTGFVTAGHCSWGATGKSIGQPTLLDVIGTLTHNSFEDGTDCDCAFVENTEESTSSKVFNGQTVSGLLAPR